MTDSLVTVTPQTEGMASSIVARCQFKENELVMPRDMTIEEWETLGAMLVQIERSCGIWIGDWINAGEHRWGQKYSQAMDATGLKNQTLRNYASTARRVAPAIRRLDEGLTTAHLAVVQKLDHHRQDKLLGDAAKNGWTARELRQNVHPRAEVITTCPTCGGAVLVERRRDGSEVFFHKT